MHCQSQFTSIHICIHVYMYTSIHTCIHVHQGCKSAVLLCCVLFWFNIKSNAGTRAYIGTSIVFSFLVKLRIGLIFFSLVESTANSPDPGFFFDRIMCITKSCYSLLVC